VAYLVVLVLAVGAGITVAVYTIRHGEPAPTGAWEATAAERPPSPVRPSKPLPGSPTWESRVAGTAGLVIAVIAAAVAVAGSLYLAWMLADRAFGSL
jgi:hypothetical protein